MKLKFLTALALTVVAVSAQADCKWAEDAVAASERRVAQEESPSMKNVHQFRLDSAKRHLTDCVETDARIAKEDARRAKLPAPRIGQRKQNINWGYPDSVRTITTAQGVVEFQHFPGGNALMYVNGILTSIQTN